ncbi:MAG: RNA polymerase sporulation sigma factor SigH [Actinomycetota bacterium]
MEDHAERPSSTARTAADPAARQRRDQGDLALVLRARNGNDAALDQLIRRYQPFVRLKASSYFLAGGDSDDLQQEGLIGLYKAIRDYRVDRETSFRSFAELCITRQIITAIKGATRNKHQPLNGYISFSHTPAGSDPEGGDCTLGDAIAGSPTLDPASRVVSTDELDSLVEMLGSTLSPLESEVLAAFMSGESYEAIAARAGCDPKAVDNALQRVKRKIEQHRSGREHPQTA